MISKKKQNNLDKQLMKRLAFLLTFSLLLLTNHSFSQQDKNLGIPFIKNFSPKEYGAKDQNWAIILDKRGVMYFGNHAGLLEYDGISWKLIELPNKSAVNSLCMDGTGRIYVGGQNELGYLSSDSVGNTKYNSLLQQIPENERNFNDVWAIFCLSSKIVFNTYSKLIVLENSAFHIIKTQTSFHSSFIINNKIYIREVGKGINVYDGNSFTLLKGSEIFANERVYVMCSFDKDRILLGTRTQNLFLYDGIGFSKFKTTCEDLLKSGRIYCGKIINDSTFAVGTVINGLLFINKSGKLIRRIDKSTGLICNEIHSIFLDKSKNLWLANGIGISKIDINSPFTYFDERNNLDTKSLVVFYGNNKLYIGGLPFLFYSDLFKIASYSFTQVEKSSYQIWKVFPFDNKIFIAQNPEQGFLDANNKFTPISSINYVWTFSSVLNKSNFLILGANEGLYYFNKIHEKWMLQGRIKGFDLVSRFIETDSLSNLWVQVPNKGVYKLRLNEKGDSVIDQKFLLEYKPLSKCIYSIDNQIISASNSKFLKYNYKTERFEDFAALNKLFPNSKDLFILGECKNGDLYFQDNFSIGKLIKKNPQDYIVYRTPFLSLEAMATDYPVLQIDESNAFIGQDKGFVHYQPSYKKDYSLPFNTLIRKVQLLPKGSILFGGNFPVSSDTFSLDQPKNQVPVLKHRYSSFRFLYSATFYENPVKTEYKYQLDGYDSNWSEWTTETKKDYTKIPEGDYTFKVKSRNIYHTEGKEAAYKFSILPPWYRTWWAYFIFFIFSILTIIFINRLYARRLRKQKVNLEKIIKERVQEIREKNIELSHQRQELISKREELETTLDSLQLTQKQLIQSEKMASIGILASGIAHEINNPLNFIQDGISGLDSYIKENLKDHTEEIAPLLDGIHIGIERASKIIFSLSNYSRRNDLPNTECDIHSIIDNCLVMLQNQTYNRIIIEKNYTGKPYTVFGNEGKLHQAFLNILVNAVEAIDNSGTITIVTGLERSRVKISIADSGCGIIEENLHQITNPFFTTKDPGKGTGLGLSITYNIINEYDGILEFESNLGKGTKVIITLPLKSNLIHE